MTSSRAHLVTKPQKWRPVSAEMRGKKGLTGRKRVGRKVDKKSQKEPIARPPGPTQYLDWGQETHELQQEQAQAHLWVLPGLCWPSSWCRTSGLPNLVSFLEEKKRKADINRSQSRPDSVAERLMHHLVPEQIFSCQVTSSLLLFRIIRKAFVRHGTSFSQPDPSFKHGSVY